MAHDTPQVTAIFDSSLLDPTGQPNLVLSDGTQSHALIWTLVNNQPDELVVTSLENGKVSQESFNFLFEFAPGALTRQPTLTGWNVYPVPDLKGGIKSLYLTWAGSDPLRIAAGDHKTASLTYTGAIQEDSHNPKVSVTLTTGQGVTLGGHPIPGRPLSLFPLVLINASVPAIATPPIAVDLVGRRTVLNDGATANAFTFALTNMTPADLNLTPDTIFSISFDAAPNDGPGGYPWAVARIQDLAATGFVLTPPSGWEVSKPPTLLNVVPVSPQWRINVTKALTLSPQEPVVFTFSGLKTDLDPGFARIYVRFEGLPGFRPGVLSAALEKTPAPYGPSRGDGLYLLAGTPTGNTPPAPNYASGLYVEQLGAGAAAVFNGGKVGIGTGTAAPLARLHIVDPNQDPNGGTIILSAGKADEPSLRFGCEPGYAWMQSHVGPLAINPILRNVGIGTATPGSALSVAGGVAIGQAYAQGNTAMPASDLAVEGRVGIGTTEPGSALSVSGGVAIGKSYAQKTTTMPANALAVEGSVAIGTTTPSAMLQIGDASTPPKMFGDVTTVGIVQRSADTVGLSVRAVGSNAVLQFCSYDEKTKSPTCNYVQVEKGTGDILLGNAGAETRVGAGKVTAPGLTLTGPASATSVALTGGLTIAGKGDVKNVIELGFGVAGKEVSAGKIGYQIWSDGLDIVGGGTTGGSRQVHLYDQVYVHGSVWMPIGNGSGGQNWCALNANDGVVKDGNWNWAVFNTSDARLKTNVAPIDSPMACLRQLHGYRYEWTDDALSHFTKECGTQLSAGPGASAADTEALRHAEREKLRRQLATPQVGVIAQEVEAVLPEAVSTDADGYKGVNYSHLIPLLIEAVKEQDAMVTALTARVDRQQRDIDRLAALVQDLLAERTTHVGQ